jgi:hypothetical protein
MCKYKIGEKVKVLPGFTSERSPGVNTYTFDNSYGGFGYLETNLTLTIKEIDESIDKDNKHAYFFQEIPNGIYEFALISVEEIREQVIDKILCG